MRRLDDRTWSLEQCITEAFATSTMGEDDHSRLLSELRTLRAKAEAWDKVAFLYPFADGPVLCSEFDEQISRLDAMKGGSDGN